MITKYSSSLLFGQKPLINVLGQECDMVHSCVKCQDGFYTSADYSPKEFEVDAEQGDGVIAFRVSRWLLAFRIATTTALLQI